MAKFGQNDDKLRFRATPQLQTAGWNYHHSIWSVIITPFGQFYLCITVSLTGDYQYSSIFGHVKRQSAAIHLSLRRQT
jgi:hypothetical protein